VTIPVVDLSRRMRRVGEDVTAGLERVLASGRLLLGEETERLEAEFAAFTGRGQAVAVASGTDALSLALRAAGVGEHAGDEVIVPAFTAMPTLAAVVAAGAVPVPVDVNPATAQLDHEAAAAAVTACTRAVVPVHLYGRPAELPRLGVPVVEDAAQAHGALFGPAGSVAAAYSFYPTKNLGGIGDGGMVVSDDAELAARVRRLRTFGLEPGGQVVERTPPSRMSEVEAMALRALLKLLPQDNERRRAIAARYRAAAPRLAWAADHPAHVHHLCVARERERMRGDLPFATAVHYPFAASQQPAYRDFVRAPCPEAEAWAATCVTLPCFPEMTDGEVETVCAALAELR
jgi:dTDP-4-amino-4,6-dideoxygalactose transaminase